MAFLSSTTLHPVDGWKYLQRETGLWIKANIHDELVEAVIAHRQHKGLTPTDRATVSLEIQRQICLSAPNGACRPEPGENYTPFKDFSRKLSLDKIAAASKTLVEWLSHGMIVPPAESAQRAAICRGCPMNQPVKNCSCTPFWKLIDSLIPSGRKEPGLFICGLCGCSLAAKVLAPLAVAREGNPPDLRLPAWCWQS